MIYYMLMFYMFMFMLLMFVIFMYMLINNFTIYLEFEILEISSVKMEFLILVDWISLLFSSVVLMISMMVLFYSMEYMYGDYNINRFMMLILMFILSMMLLIFMPNMISLLLGWDGLGLVSYCLVIYYQSKSSYNSGMITVLMNRVGDILILISIGMLIIYGSWNFIFFYKMNFMIFMMLMLASFTKSAQIPFSSWLPLAMAAPTPVSSLVHSSTLVTAGVYLLIRLNYLLKDDKLINLMLMFSVITMFLAGLGANFEFDLKKIIALSTLSQLGIMIFCLSMNLMEVSLFHLLTHAMFKSMLFMCAGIIIHNMMYYQDIRLISMTLYNLPLVSLMFNCSSLSLCGIPFLSGFFSKDLILDMFLMSYMNKFLLIILFISMGLTIMYTMRLMYYSFIKFPQLNIYVDYNSMNSSMMISMYMLFFMSIMKGLILSWMLFSMKNMIYLTFTFKMIIYFFMMLGVFIGYLFTNMFFSKMLLKYCNKFIKFFMMMWFMPMLYGSHSPILLNFTLDFIYCIELNWLESMMSGWFIKFIQICFKLNYLKTYFFYLLPLFIFMLILMNF